MEMLNYVPFTAREVAFALEYSDCDEMTGEYIAEELLSGVEAFTGEELNKLAEYKGITAEFLSENDPAFLGYTDPCTVLRKVIAENALNYGIDAEAVSKICGLPLETVEKLKQSCLT